MSVHVERRGTGRDLVFLHGWGAGARIWDGLARELQDAFRLHLVDLPGYGASEACAPYALDALVSSVAEVCPDRVAVCGWSLGAQVAMQWVLARPAQVSRLVLFAATPRFVSAADWPHGLSVETLAAFGNSVRDDPGEALARFATLQAMDDTHRTAVIKTLRTCAQPLPAKSALSGGLDVLRSTDLRAAAARIACPLLLIHGGCDRVVPPAASAALAADAREAKRTVVAGAGHAAFIAREARFAGLIREFAGDD